MPDTQGRMSHPRLRTVVVARIAPPYPPSKVGRETLSRAPIPAPTGAIR